MTGAAFVELLGGAVFDVAHETSYRNKRAAANTHYSVGAVLFCVAMRDAPYAEYMQECRRANIGVVSVVDRKELLAFVTTTAAASSVHVDDAFVPTVPYASVQEAVMKREASVASAAMEVDGVEAKGSDSTAASSDAYPLAECTPDAIWANVKHRQKETHHSRNALFSTKDYAAVLKTAKDLLQKDKKHAPSAGTVPTSVLDSIKQRVSAAAASSEAPTRSSKAAAASTNAPSAAASRPAFILVPPGYNAPITMFNVLAFLRDARYIPSHEARAANPKKSNRIEVVHTFADCSRTKTFTIIDNTNRLAPEDWQYVVAVFATGDAWQFTGWKWADPVMLFSQGTVSFVLHFPN